MSVGKKVYAAYVLVFVIHDSLGLVVLTFVMFN